MSPTPLMLSDEDKSRVEEVEALARSGAESLDKLVELLPDPSWAVRRSVVHALATIGDPAVAPLSRVLVERGGGEARLAAAVDALAASRGAADPAMLALASGPYDPATLCDAVQVLGRRRCREAIALLTKLSEHTDDNVAVASLEALGRIGGTETVEPLVQSVNSRNFFRTFPAIDALGRTGDVRAVRALASLLGDPLYTPELIRALGRTAQASAVPPLAKLLLSPADAIVRATAAALADLRERHDARFGASEAVIEALHAAVDTSRASERVLQALPSVTGSELAAIAHVLGYLGDPPAIHRLVELASDAEPVASAAQEALRRLGARATPQIVAALREGTSLVRARLLPLLRDAKGHLDDVVRCLEDDDADVRVRACDALARIGDPKAVTALFAVLGDSDSRVAQAATAAIHSLGSLDTKRLTLERATSSDLAVRRAALRILAYFAYPEGLDIVLGALVDDDERVREAAIFGLPLFADPRALEALLSSAQHTSARTRSAAARSLGQTKPTAPVVAALVKAASDEDAWVRYYACQSLGKLRVDGAVDTLVRASADSSGQVRVAAIEALAQLRAESAFTALSAAARSADPDLARAAIAGLGAHRRPETIPLLREAMSSPIPATRLAALGALSAMNTAEIVPILAFATTDPNGAVRSSAIGYLATRPSADATRALLDCLLVDEVRDRTFESLAVAADERIEHVLAALESADADRAPLYAQALLRMRKPSAHAALAEVMRSSNVHGRRAAAEALITLDTAEARNALAVAGTVDPDEDVRRICAAAPAVSTGART